MVLAAHPMQTGKFARSLILLCAHGPAAGAAGVILNRPSACLVAQLPAERGRNERLERLEQAGLFSGDSTALLNSVRPRPARSAWERAPQPF